MNKEPKKTPLYEWHTKLGGKIVDYAGWSLPIKYKGIKDEHNAVRERAGLFDVSHMGEIEISGPQAMPFLQRLLTNNVAKLAIDQVLYSPMCNQKGGVIDDLLVYRRDHDRYLLVVNAGNMVKDYEWIEEQKKDFPKAKAANLSFTTGQIALQGPLAQKILDPICEAELASLKFFWSCDTNIGGVSCLVSRTGYTGEDGFEIYTDWAKLPEVFETVWESGQKEGLAACGLGARNTLRFEAALPLYGYELSMGINPFEARLSFFVDLGKGDFIGREPLLKVKEEGLARRLVGIEMLARGIPREGYAVATPDGTDIGYITSGSYAPALGKNLGMALVEKEHAKKGTDVSVKIRNKALVAVIIKLPFYKRGG